MTTTLTIALTFALICFVAGESVVSLVLNKAEGQMYVLSTDSRLYELDNVAVAQNNQHNLSVSSPPTITSAHIKKINGQKYLFQVLSDTTNYGTSLARFDLPFGNKQTLTPSEVSNPGYGYTGVPTVFDDNELIAIAISNGNELNLFDLVTVNLTSSIRLFAGLRVQATAVLYNHKTHTAVVFWYQFMVSSRTYDLRVNEYKVVGNQFVQANTTYPVVNTNFTNTEAVYAAFDISNDKYWILDDSSNRLVKFNADNLAVFSFISLGAVTFSNGLGTVVYNFGAQLAYVISDATHGYHLQEVDLTSGTIRRSKTYNTGGHFAITAELDVEQGNLYVGLISDPTVAAKLSVVDLGNLSQQIITMNKH